MLDRKWRSDRAKFWLYKDNTAKFDHFLLRLSEFTVMPFISVDGTRYKVTGFIDHKNITNYLCNDRLITTISFDPLSEIYLIPISFIFYCKSTLYLPPMIKRIFGDSGSDNLGPNIIYDKNNKFVSTIGKKNIINHHPLELLCQKSRKQDICIRETIRIVGRMSFYGNPNIRSIVFPASVEVIGKSSFFECESLQDILFIGKSRLRKIGKSAFSKTSIRSIYFPPSLEKISNYAFSSCKRLIMIYFQVKHENFDDEILETTSITEIGNKAFTYCKNLLIAINLKKCLKLTKIGKKAFCKCKNLANIEFPPNIKEIGEFSFENCLIRSVSLKDCSQLEHIVRLAFSNCYKLRDFEFPEESRIKRINENCFMDTGIKSIHIPSSVELIGSSAFGLCSVLENVTFAKNSNLKVIDITCFAESNIESINIPSSVVEISSSAFKSCSNLKSVTFEENSMLKKIQPFCFQCTNIESIRIPPSVQYIGDYAFDNYDNLKIIFLSKESKGKIKFGFNTFGKKTKVKIVYT